MSDKVLYEKIRKNPKFTQLCQERGRFSVILSLIVLVPYYVFMMTVAFNPTFFADKFGDSKIMTIGWPIGAVIIIGSWLLTGVYIRRANGAFEELNEEVIAEARK
ncbi:DUF485 domain-containing protein [Fluviibacter phosphoraccumulans]|uniref:DUF485 domain-containing protein n=1 Tax=Fluviibacter phosphoraccumulans TaxID=1751046 RepID=UPI0010BAC55A|nr:DUF485 domain-containing protein [Fluviibacter phosphoraccumulans]BCA64924.1 membrane protein [Fluviibacter phosphoraccumulans]